MPQSLGWHSIERRLPLLICLLLLVLVVGFAWLGYGELRRLAVVAAEERLARVVRQLVAATELSNYQRIEEFRAAAEEPAMSRLARRMERSSGSSGPVLLTADAVPRTASEEPVPPPDPVGGSAPEGASAGRSDGATAPLFRSMMSFRAEDEVAVDALRRLATVDRTELVALVDGDGRTLVAVTGDAAPPNIHAEPLAPPGLGESDMLAASSPAEGGSVPPGVVGPLRGGKGRVFYEIWLPIHDGDRVWGHMVHRRRVTANARAIALIEGLVGPEAAFMFGNAEGDVWTDLESRVDPPPAAVLAPWRGPVRYQRPDGGDWYGVAEPIANTPWAILVEQPASVVFAPLEDTLVRVAIMAAALVLVGFGAALLISRRITTPLGDLTVAAEAVAGGDYSRRVRVDRPDEMGILGDAFNTMAAEVERSREELEDRVERRTAELRDTLQKLEQAQDELLRKERLAVLGKLAGGVGHELRNPLGVMSNAVYILKQTMEEPPARTCQYLDVLERQIKTAEKIIEDLLDVARVRSPERQRVELEEIVRTQLVRAEMPAEVEQRLEIATDVPEVWVDPTQVGQVVYNLITNAVQAMDGAGTLTLVASTREGAYVDLRVADSGPGVTAEQRDKIFEPLYTTKARGIGLGLSVSRTLAVANDGEIQLLDGAGSEQGGAVFVLTLPVAPESDELAGPESDDVGASDGGRT